MYYLSTVNIATARYQFFYYFYLGYFSEKWTKCTIVYLTTMILLLLLFFRLKFILLLFLTNF